MKIIYDILIAIPMGILYNLMVIKFGDIMNGSMQYKIKIQRNLLLAFGCAVLAWFLSQYIFGPDCKFENRAIKYGLWLGIFILLVHVILYNWNVLENDTKLIMMMLMFIILMVYSYRYVAVSEIDDIEEDDF
jgi:hypothetical protein